MRAKVPKTKSGDKYLEPQGMIISTITKRNCPRGSSGDKEKIKEENHSENDAGYEVTLPFMETETQRLT